MNKQLQEIRDRALKMLSEAETLDKLNEARVSFLGKKGELTAVLKSMNNIAPEERPAFGQMVNETRQTIEAHLEETRARLEETLRQRQMEQAHIAVRVGHLLRQARPELVHVPKQRGATLIIVQPPAAGGPGVDALKLFQ